MRALTTAAFLALTIAACSSHDIESPYPSAHDSGSALAFGGAPASAQGGPWLFAYDGTEHISTTKSLSIGDVLNILSFPIVAPTGPTLNNYDPWSGGKHTGYVEIDLTNVASSNLTITGIVAGNDGDELVLWNGGGSPGNYPDTITYTNNDTGSTALNRLWLGNGKQIRIPNNDGLRLHYIGAFGWVSVGNTGTIVRANQFSLDPACVPTALTSSTTYTDYNPFTCTAGFTSYVRQDVTGGGTARISGLQFSGPPNQEGREILFQNISTSGSIAITNDVGTAGNHILTPTGGDLTLGPKQSMTLHYDRDAVVYRVDSYTGPTGITAASLTNPWAGTSTTTATFDGAATVCNVAPAANVYSLSEDCFLGTATVNNGITVKARGWRIFVSGTLTNNGTISDNGAAGTNAVTSTPGVDGVARSAGFYIITLITGQSATNEPRGLVAAAGSVAGGNGGAGVNANGAAGTSGAANSCQGGGGGGGGGGAFGGAGNGTAGGSIALMSVTAGYTDIITIVRGIAVSTLGSTAEQFSGTAGGLGGDGTAGGGAGGAHGGAGASAGVVFVAATDIAGSGVFQAKGGAGGNGGSPVGATAGAGGAGAGGGGGYVFLIYSHGSGTWTTDVTGGAHGVGPSGGGHGDGGNGGDGGSCVALKINLSGDGT